VAQDFSLGVARSAEEEKSAAPTINPFLNCQKFKSVSASVGLTPAGGGRKPEEGIRDEEVQTQQREKLDMLKEKSLQGNLGGTRPEAWFEE